LYRANTEKNNRAGLNLWKINLFNLVLNDYFDKEIDKHILEISIRRNIYGRGI